MVPVRGADLRGDRADRKGGAAESVCCDDEERMEDATSDDVEADASVGGDRIVVRRGVSGYSVVMRVACVPFMTMEGG